MAWGCVGVFWWCGYVVRHVCRIFSSPRRNKKKLLTKKMSFHLHPSKISQQTSTQASSHQRTRHRQSLLLPEHPSRKRWVASWEASWGMPECDEEACLARPPASCLLVS